MADFIVHGTGRDTVLVLTPVTPEAREWCADHLPDDATRIEEGYVVENRYVGPILEGIFEAGLEVR